MWIRSFKDSDIPSLKALYLEGKSILPCIRDKKRSRHADFSRILSNPVCPGRCINTIYCYEEDGQVIGFACCMITQTDDGRSNVELRQIYFLHALVRPDLLEQAVSMLESKVCMGATIVIIRFSGLYEKAVAFWQSVGYMRAKPLLFIDDDVKIVMTKALDRCASPPATAPIAGVL